MLDKIDLKVRRQDFSFECDFLHANERFPCFHGVNAYGVFFTQVYHHLTCVGIT